MSDELEVGAAVAQALSRFECADCGDEAGKHFARSGPCAGCWERMVVICKRFRPRDEDRAEASRLLVSAGAQPLEEAQA